MNRQPFLKLGPIPRRRKKRFVREEAPIWRPAVPQQVPQIAIQFPTGHPVKEYELKSHPKTKS